MFKLLSIFPEPKEIAHTIVYLLSDFASNITGGKIVSDGGFLANWTYNGWINGTFTTQKSLNHHRK